MTLADFRRISSKDYLTDFSSGVILSYRESMLYLVRHGQTDWNNENRLQGETDIPLNETGRAQAAQAKNALSGVVFDKVFCSPMLRAQQTCKIIYDGETELDARLRERGFGKYEGLKAEEVDFAGMWMPERAEEFVGIEGIFELKDRVYDFLDEITVKYKGKNILAVCHGGVAYFFRTYFDGFPENGNVRRHILENGEVVSFEI